MAKFRNIICILLIILLLSACGSVREADGIDSVTYISDIASEAPGSDTDESADNEPLFSGKTLSKLDNVEFSSSIYLLFMREALENVLSRYEAAPEDVPALEVLLEDGTVITAKEFCETYAKNEFKWVCLLVSDYMRCGGELIGSAHYQAAASKANAAFSTDTSSYTCLGAGLNDLILYYIYTDLYYDDFVLRYSPNGENAISEEDLSILMENNARKISYTFLPFYDELTNRDFSDAEKAELVNISEEYLKRYKNGESFSAIVAENHLLMDSYNLSYDPNETYVYYSTADPMLPSSLTARAESLEDYEAAIVKDEDFVSVVQRLPVNETTDEKWMLFAMGLAYKSEYGDSFSEDMSAAYDRLDLKYIDEVLSQLTLENLITAVYSDK